MTDVITPDMVKALGAALVACLSLTLTAIGFLIRAAYKLGQNAQSIGKSLEELTSIKTAVLRIPIIETRLGIVEEAWKTARSDIKHLLRGSHPDMNGEE
jgi:hypothetical protein